MFNPSPTLLNDSCYPNIKTVNNALQLYAGILLISRLMIFFSLSIVGGLSRIYTGDF